MIETAISVVGEIAIIVVGVLLALAVDHWKQERGDRAKESRLLRGLATDLQQDIDGLQAFQDELRADVDATHLVLRILRRQEEADAATLPRQLLRAANGYEPVYALATYTDLAGGNFHLLTNEELKRKVIEYYSILMTGERVNSPTTPQVWYDTGIEPYFVSLFDVLPPGDWLGWFHGEKVDIDAKQVVAKLREAPKIEGNLEAALRGRALQLSKYKMHEQRAAELHKDVVTQIGA